MKKIIPSMLLMIFSIAGFAQIHTDPTSGNIGIGTTTPQTKLEVRGNEIKNEYGISTPVALVLSTNTPQVGTGATIGLGGRTGLATADYAFAYMLGAKENNINYAGYFAIHTVAGDANVGEASSGNYERLRVTSTGNVGIGTTTPSEKLGVYGVVNSAPGVLALETSRNDAGFVEVGSVRAKNNGGEVARIGLLRGGGTYTGEMNFMVRPTNDGNLQEAMRINQAGNIGIGTTSPSEKLSVNGKIRAKEVKVEAANWPDYVFEKGYKVEKLEELESYIKLNKHLPGIPSAKEVAANGIELGEMNKLLLKKVEELTLHLIEKDKQLQSETLVTQKQQVKIEGLEKGYLELKEQLQLLMKRKNN